MSENKKTILTISDHPLSPSGVGTQTRYVLEALLRTGKYRVLSLAGAIKHADYRIVSTPEFKQDWLIKPVDGYGSQEIIRGVMNQDKPDFVWIMTDPRFYGWLWQIEEEIRAKCPLIYYHVWDNYPYPDYNAVWYRSNDFVATISKVTDDVVATLAPEVERKYIPHAVDSEIFKNRKDEKLAKDFRKEMQGDKEKMIFFWNNRNARRKQSGTLIFWFKEFLDQVGHDKAVLCMHTDVKDQHGQDLEKIIKYLGMDQGQVKFSTKKISSIEMASLYSASDCTINISDAEGFGLATLESLSCETPIIVNMTGGLQEQVTDGEKWFGIGIEPASKAVIGSQDIPYIYEDRLNKQDFLDAMNKFYSMTKEEREKLGKEGREHTLKNYNFENFKKTWIETFEHIAEKNGSWENRKNYQSWRLEEL
tara:strand:- start:6893 stop:8152 length:1260 start_codon:yes stop_codon:yes gene_type:complete